LEPTIQIELKITSLSCNLREGALQGEG